MYQVWQRKIEAVPIRLPQLLPHRLVRRMRIHRRGQRAHVPGDLSPIIISQGLAQAHNGRVEGMGELQWRESPRPARSARARVAATDATARVSVNIGGAGSG